MSDEWRADGKELHFSADPHDFVGLHTEALPEAIAARHNATAHQAAQWRHANIIAARVLVQKEAQIGALERQLTILQNAARPAATILFNLTQQPGIDPHVVETIQQTLAPLDAALAATKGSI